MASPTELTAFVVALVAFIIALLQVIQQYMATSSVRNKVGRAAIGVWVRHNKRSWNFREWKVRVEYLQPSLTWKNVEACLERQKLEDHLLLSPFKGKYQLAESHSMVSGAQGTRYRRSPELVLTRIGGDIEGARSTVSIESLNRTERGALAKYHKFLADRDAPRERPCMATWVDLMAAVVGNPLHLARVTSKPFLIDADTIPSSLDTPMMPIHFSDLISCGVALDMEMRDCDLHKPSIHMTGQYCNIMSQEQSGVGTIARYTCKPNHVHHLQACTPSEVNALLRTAKGYIYVGDACAHMTDWGYNSVDTLFQLVCNREPLDDEDWFQMGVMSSFRSSCEGDTDIQWKGRWNQPATTRVGFLLTHCGNPAIINSFTHSLLKEWSHAERTIAGHMASDIINTTIGFIESPPDFCSSLHSKGVVMNSYKLANNWGAEHGGIRGWSSSCGAEFVKKASECWSVAKQSEHVPILPNLRPLLEQGELGPEWGKTYNATTLDRDEKSWRPRADTLCWIQIMLLDTWIARQVDLMMLGVTEEAAVPVDSNTANICAFVAVTSDDQAKGRTTGWKRCRAWFIRYYLARLANGRSPIEGESPVGVSCMSSGGGIGLAGWDAMPKGEASDWATVDAVLTLRAVVMATRFELMHNTDVFLELQEFDPMIRMA
ncbi:hypothetical protein B0H19DRAFT_1140488 [Mycena capillaripes]|nr:hypothetical protein B0H19DRAFT_1140488 [Mycena capillaripes]